MVLAGAGANGARNGTAYYFCVLDLPKPGNSQVLIGSRATTIEQNLAHERDEEAKAIKPTSCVHAPVEETIIITDSSPTGILAIPGVCLPWVCSGHPSPLLLPKRCPRVWWKHSHAWKEQSTSQKEKPRDQELLHPLPAQHERWLS